MKKVLFAATVLAAMFFVAGCGSSPGAFNDPNLPPWLNDSAPTDAIWGDGSAKLADTQLAREAATARARVSITRQIEVRVKSMFDNYQQAGGTADETTSLNFVRDVSRQLTDKNLSGARPIQQWRAPDGTWWVRVEIKTADLSASSRAIFDSEAARYAEFKADEAMRLMDSELSRSTRPEVVTVD